LTFQALWLVLTLFAFALGFIAVGVPTFAQGLETSGSSLFTRPRTDWSQARTQPLFGRSNQRGR
jgi:hypothetical protein